MIPGLIVAARDRGRVQDIIAIVSRFGLGALLARFGLERGAEPGGADPPDLPRRARQALEALGPTFVKLGQILATRADLLPPEWIAELERLHSGAPTLDFEALRPALEEALGEPPESAFAWFDPVPLAAASIAQVHRARLHDGREVVLKIRRPGIRRLMEADLRLIARLAATAEKASAEARRFAPRDMLAQLAEAILDELDFTTEGRNADRIRADFAGDPRLVVPEIHWAFTSDALLVMDYVEGVPPRDAAALVSAGIDPAAIAALGADVVLDMVLVNGRFHGDPHPGNLLCLPGNRLALLDLGMIGHVSPRRRGEFVAFVQAIATGDPAALADVLVQWNTAPGVPAERIRLAAERIVARHGGGRLVMSAMVRDFLALVREQGMAMPPDLLLIFKALITMDGVLLAIQPDFDLSEAMQRSWLRVVQARLSPDAWGPVLQGLAWELARLGGDAPRLVRAAARRLESDAAAPADPAPAIRDAGTRIAAAIALGAAMVAAAILLG